jgi:HAE1 family hydrophobic/amphiphilic exporter-1
MLAVMLFGMVGFSRLAVKLLPDLSYPSVTIRTAYDVLLRLKLSSWYQNQLKKLLGW